MPNGLMCWKLDSKTLNFFKSWEIHTRNETWHTIHFLEPMQRYNTREPEIHIHDSKPMIQLHTDVSTKLRCHVWHLNNLQDGDTFSHTTIPVSHYYYFFLSEECGTKPGAILNLKVSPKHIVMNFDNDGNFKLGQVQELCHSQMESNYHSSPPRPSNHRGT